MILPADELCKAEDDVSAPDELLDDSSMVPTIEVV